MNLKNPGDVGAETAKEGDKLRHFKNKGKYESASKYFGSNVSKPGSIGEKGNSK